LVLFFKKELLSFLRLMPTINTARLTLTPVGGRDLAELVALKADPQVFGLMLGGIRSPWQTADELAADVAYWATRGVGIFAVRERSIFHGITGIHDRPDGRGAALRFALWPEARGRGLAREAASAALRFAHDHAGLKRVVAVAREDNFGSRMVLGSIGMSISDTFLRDGHKMLVYCSES
jgi:RimJ/RimL family protein N-acetyltransferase